MEKILFLHGFASSGAYKMASMLRQLMKPCEVTAPDLPVDPGAALHLAETLLREGGHTLVVGLSLGGFLALHLKGAPRVAVNPDLHPSAFLEGRMGTVEYLSPRLDGETSFILDDATVAAYARLEKEPVEGGALGCFALGDELVHCRETFEAQALGKVFTYKGGHLPTYPEMKFSLVPAIQAYISGTA